MTRTLLLPFLLLLGAGTARTTGVAAQDAAAVFEHLEGTWAGPGTLFGQPAAFTMRWDVSGGLATLHFTNALVDADGNETPVMSAAAVYRIDGEAEGVWLDSRGERVELAWTVAEGALVVDWRASAESGRTTYRPLDGDRVEVVDEVSAADGWRVFGTAAHTRVDAVPVRPSAPTGPLDAVAFMAGTWCSSPPSGGTMIEEHYTTPSANLVLGTTRYLRDGATVGHEITRIGADSAGVVLTPTPSGQAAVPFRLTESAPGRAVFENPEHDFPVRIEYERVGDELVARALGADGAGPEWRMSPCPDGPA